MLRGGYVAHHKQNSRIWEFLTASLEEKSSFQNRKFENFASLESGIYEDLVYAYISGLVERGDYQD